MLLLHFYFFDFLSFSLYLQFLVLLDGLIILHAVVSYNQSLVFFVPLHFVLDLLHLPLDFLFHLFDLFLFLLDLFSLYLLSLVVEGMELQEIEFVPCGHL